MTTWQNAPYGLRPACSINGGSWVEKTNNYNISTAVVNGATIGYGANLFLGDPIVWGTSVGNAPIATAGSIGGIAIYQPNYVDATPSTFGGTGAAPILGVFMGCSYESVNVSVNNVVRSPYYPASTQVIPGTVITAKILDDPSIVYDIQLSTNIDANGNAFVASPTLPNLNATGGAPFNLAGFLGRNFALMIGGGTNFNTVANDVTRGTGLTYANNPATGNVRTGISAFYLCASTTTQAGATHDYDKTVTTLPLRAISYSKIIDNVAYPTLAPATTPFMSVQVMLNNTAVGTKSGTTVYVA